MAASTVSTFRDDDCDKKCPICMDFYETPKLLPCQHCYCLECLFKHYEFAFKSASNKESSPGGVSCPVCRQFHEMTSSSSSSTMLTKTDFDERLPNNYLALPASSFLNVKQKVHRQLREMAEKFRLRDGGVKTKFDATTTDFNTASAKFFRHAHPCLCGNMMMWACSACDVVLCDQCFVEHCESHPDHETFSVDDLSAVDIRRDKKNVPKTTATKEMPTSSENELNDADKVYVDCLCGECTSWQCKTCHTSLCNTCFAHHLEAFDACTDFAEIHPSVGLKNRRRSSSAAGLSTLENSLSGGKREIETALRALTAAAAGRRPTCDLLVVNKRNGSVLTDTGRMTGELSPSVVDDDDDERRSTFLKIFSLLNVEHVIEKKTCRSIGGEYVLLGRTLYRVKMRHDGGGRGDEEERLALIGKSPDGAFVAKNADKKHVLIIVFKNCNLTDEILEKFIH